MSNSSNSTFQTSSKKLNRGRTLKRLVEFCDHKSCKHTAENPYKTKNKKTYDGSISVIN